VRVPRQILSDNFTNYYDAFNLLHALLTLDPVRTLRTGGTVIDIEDGSNEGNYPRVAFCSSLPQATLITDSYFYKYRGYETLRASVAEAWLPWEERIPLIFWRGSTTGRRMTGSPPVDDWTWLPRLHLSHLTNTSSKRDIFDVGVSRIVQIPEPHIADVIREKGLLRDPCEKIDFLKYRYLIDIDGNANAWDGLFGAMIMGACVLKVASPFGYRQWYYSRLVPWTHFIPVRSDLADLEEKAEWALSHPAECQAMARELQSVGNQLLFEPELRAAAVNIAQRLTQDMLDCAA
jgi:hypothetical protein